jgi:hypothetical protein
MHRSSVQGDVQVTVLAQTRRMPALKRVCRLPIAVPVPFTLTATSRRDSALVATVDVLIAN